MNNLNSVLIEGQLTVDPVLIYQANGVAECRITLLSVRTTKDGDEYIKQEHLFSAVAYNHLAEVVHEYCRAGRGVRIVGKLRSRNIDGRTMVDIVAEHVEFKPEKKVKPPEAQAEPVNP